MRRSDLPQSTVSRHLAYLRKRGLVVGRKEGLWVHYRLAKPVGELHRTPDRLPSGMLQGNRDLEVRPAKARIAVLAAESEARLFLTQYIRLDGCKREEIRDGSPSNQGGGQGAICARSPRAKRPAARSAAAPKTRRGWPSRSAIPPPSWRRCPRGRTLAFPAAIRRRWRRCSRAKPCSTSGSGAGFDCFLAARQVGPAGRVIGVDMTDAMLEKARANAEKSGLGNVEFRKGEIEALPVDDNSVDVTISNCVLNLVPDKDRAFREIHRVSEARRAAGRLGHGLGSRARGVGPQATWKPWSAASAGRWSWMIMCRGSSARVLTSVEVEKHPEAVRKMIEVSGDRAAAWHRASAQRQHHGHQMRSITRHGLSLIAALALGAGPAPAATSGRSCGPSGWSSGTGRPRPSIPRNDQRVKGVLFKALGKDGELTLSELDGLYGTRNIQEAGRLG